VLDALLLVAALACSSYRSFALNMGFVWLRYVLQSVGKIDFVSQKIKLKFGNVAIGLPTTFMKVSD
jgi:hypothetical protein